MQCESVLIRIYDKDKNPPKPLEEKEEEEPDSDEDEENKKPDRPDPNLAPTSMDELK